MFDVLVYLYENYYRPDLCPEPVALAKSLSDVGFKETEIKEALVWLTDLAIKTEVFFNDQPDGSFSSSRAHRIYASQEYALIGAEAIGFIQSLEWAGVLTPVQREIVIERALAVEDMPLSLDKLRIIVLMILWTNGDEPDALLLDALFPDVEEREARLLH